MQKKILQDYRVPSNCQDLAEARVNPEIWETLSSNLNKKSDTPELCGSYGSRRANKWLRGNQSKPFLGNRGGNQHPPRPLPTVGPIPRKDEIHKELNIIKAKVNDFLQYINSHLIPYLRATVQGNSNTNPNPNPDPTPAPVSAPRFTDTRLP